MCCVRCRCAVSVLPGVFVIAVISWSTFRSGFPPADALQRAQHNPAQHMAQHQITDKALVSIVSIFNIVSNKLKRRRKTRRGLTLHNAAFHAAHTPPSTLHTRRLPRCTHVGWDGTFALQRLLFSAFIQLLFLLERCSFERTLYITHVTSTYYVPNLMLPMGMRTFKILPPSFATNTLSSFPVIARTMKHPGGPASLCRKERKKGRKKGKKGKNDDEERRTKTTS